MKTAVWGALLVLGLAAIAPAYATDESDALPAAPAADPCPDCPAQRPHYDSQEVVQDTRTIDRSRVINTQTVVPVSRQVRESNHLVIRKNETRNVGVVRHNHTIIEKEIKWVKRGQVRYVRPAVTTINFVTRKYRVVEQPSIYQQDTTVVYGPGPDCNCTPPRAVRTKYRAPLRVRG